MNNENLWVRSRLKTFQSSLKPPQNKMYLCVIAWANVHNTH